MTQWIQDGVYQLSLIIYQCHVHFVASLSRISVSMLDFMFVLGELKL